MRNKKSIIIVCMCLAVLFMVVVFAALQTRLVINGSGNIMGNWNIEISNIQSVATGTAYNISEPTYNGTNATFNTGLKKPGDKMTYTITISNYGNIDAIISEVKAQNLGKNNFTIHTISGLKENQELLKGQAINFTVTVEFDSSATYIPEDGGEALDIDIVCVQKTDTTLPEEDIIINTATTTTLSGNTTLQLSNHLPSRLLNYTIKGNSVQNGTPSPTDPVEIQSVGVFTKNIVNIPNIKVNDVSSTIKTNLTQPFCVSAQEFPTSIQNNSGVETSIWRFSFTYKDGTLGYITDDVLRNKTSQRCLSASDDNPVVSINIRSTYIKKGEYSGFQLEYGTAVTEYEPYGYKVPVAVTGKNLVKPLSNQTSNGVTITVDNNGVVTLNGTCTGSTNVTFDLGNLPAGTYSLVDFAEGAFPSNSYARVQVLFGSLTNIFTSNSSLSKYVASVDVSEATTTKLRIRLQEGFTYNNSKLKPMLLSGSYTSDTIPNYEKYIEPKTYNIYLDEPLRCVGTTCDTIDFKTKQIVRNVVEYTFTGTENVKSYTNGLYISVEHKQTAGMSTHFEYLSYQLAGSNKFSTNINTGGIHFFVTDTVADFKSWLTTQYNNGTPVKIYYVLSSPDPNSIDLPNIDIPNGNITISIDDDVSVPITIEYYKK